MLGLCYTLSLSLNIYIYIHTDTQILNCWHLQSDNYQTINFNAATISGGSGGGGGGGGDGSCLFILNCWHIQLDNYQTINPNAGTIIVSGSSGGGGSDADVDVARLVCLLLSPLIAAQSRLV